MVVSLLSTAPDLWEASDIELVPPILEHLIIQRCYFRVVDIVEGEVTSI